MANLTTTQPGAFDAFLALLTTAGNAQNPKVTIFDSEVLSYEPGSYVELLGFANHEYQVAALGSFAQYEEYEICGTATYLQGNTDAKAVRDATFTLFQNVVMATVVANRGANGTQVLGSSAPAALEWIIPRYAKYTASPGNFGGGQSGFQGSIDFAFGIHARITVT